MEADPPHPQDPAMVALAALMRRGADSLAVGGAGGGPEELRLLRTLGYLPDPVPLATTANRTALLRAAADFVRVFQLHAPSAPAMAVFGAEMRPPTVARAGWQGPLVGVSGTGLTPGQAFEACIGEGVELLSQFETDDDAPRWRRGDGTALGVAKTLRDLAQDASGWTDASGGADATSGATEIDWFPGQRVCDGTPVWLPVDFCLRRADGRRDFVPPYPLSIGCAAGPTRDDAAVHALLELIERDAAALWWRGGRRGRALALESPALRGAAAMLTQLRQGQASRTSWLLDITTDIGVPAVAALSCLPDGAGICCGLAARPAMGDAACAAILELCQMELAGDVVLAKQREQGFAALNERDHAHLRRQASLRADDCILLHPLPGLRQPEFRPGTNNNDTLRLLAARLAEHDMDTLAVELTRPGLDIPVMRMMCPGLELEPSRRVGARLRREIERTGGGETYTGGVGLM